jgi:hypothetical protein
MQYLKTITIYFMNINMDILFILFTVYPKSTTHGYEYIHA